MIQLLLCYLTWRCANLILQKNGIPYEKTTFLLSLFHSIISFAGAVFTVWSHYPIDIITFYSPEFVILLKISISYWFYDIVELYKMQSDQISLIVHHVLFSIGGLLAIHYQLTLGFFAVGLITELSAIFLSIRGMMKLYPDFPRRLYALNSNMVVITFILTRLPIPVWLFYTSIIRSAEFNWTLPKIGSVFITGILVIINWYWFIRYFIPYIFGIKFK